MKKIILIAVIALVSKFSEAQVTFGLQVGANIGMGKFKYNDAYFAGTTSHSQKNKAKVGLLGGFLAEIPIGSSLAFRPELNFFQEGTKASYTASDLIDIYTEEQKITLNYIQLPLNVVYKVSAGSGTAFFGLGPAVEFGLSGKSKYKGTNTGAPDFNKTYDVKFDGKKSEDADQAGQTSYYDNYHLKRVDVAINVLAGYKLEMGVFVKLGYSHGFMDLSPDKNDPDQGDRYSYKNSGFNVSVGYMIGGGGGSKKKK